jgi:hypothetical protein
MEERHIQQLVQNLYERFEYLGEDHFNLDAELSQLTHPITRDIIDIDAIHSIEQGFLTKIQYKRSHDGAILIPVSVVSDPKEHDEWYPEWLNTHNDNRGSYYWKRLEDFLSNELSFKHGANSAGEIVRSIDEATHSIMEKLANPLRHEFSYKGLVVGYVQSGKTANFTALIAKAADAGYKLIIILAGIHNVLRRQTQVRLDRELTGIRDIDEPENYISLPGAANAWQRLTTAHNDFTIANLGLFSNYCQSNTPIIAVVKKNVIVLDRLISYFSNASSELRSRLPVLLIDDEADQASINGNANDPDSDPTSTNERIRAILSLFNRKVYIGYTATPFANALIDMSTDHDILQDDLYPRNFIVSLPKPSGYFGSAAIFNSNLSERFVEEIPDEGNELLRHNEMTENLSIAIDQFVLSCAIRNLRGDSMKPMSMLVHISHRINNMNVLNRIINQYVQEIHGRYNDNNLSEILKDQYKEIWDNYIDDSLEINNGLGLSNNIPDFKQVWYELENVFEKLQVLELNSQSEDTLDYTTSDPIKIIAIGGNQLSRGLTLEGLMISYYLRASRQYDTLLQMARWFGYRQGYEDLTRVHTTEQIWSFFEHLALVEEEIRSEIYRYEEDRTTPMQMAIAIRAHRNLNVTARNKMGAAKPRQTSYSGSLNQTIWFPLDQPGVLQANLNLGNGFIYDIQNQVGFTNINESGVYLANQKIAGELVLERFLNRYNFIDTENTGGPGLDAENLLSYIFRRINDTVPELTEWSIAVVGNSNPTAENDPITFGGLSLNRIQRSRKFTKRGFNIGVLTEPDHLNIDVDNSDTRSPQNPLLLLYLIWKDSKARNQIINPVIDQRIDLYRDVNTEKIDVLGIAILLPFSRQEPNNYIGQ